MWAALWSLFSLPPPCFFRSGNSKGCFGGVQAFIEPDLKLAHIRVVNRFNPFSALVKPMYILKTAAQVDTEKIQALLGPGCTVTEEKSYGIITEAFGGGVMVC